MRLGWCLRAPRWAHAGTTYTELGTDYLAGRDQPDRRRRHPVKQLEQPGYQVELTTAA